MKPKVQAPSSFPDLESYIDYIDYIVGNAGNMAASSPLKDASQTFTDGPFKGQTMDQVLQWAQTEGMRAGLRPRSSEATPVGAQPAAPAVPPRPTPQPQAAPTPGAAPAAVIANAAATMGPIGGAISAGINALTNGQTPPRPQRPQTTPGATFEGKPAAQWFQDAANRQGVDNKYAQVQKPQAAPPAPVATAPVAQPPMAKPAAPSAPPMAAPQPKPTVASATPRPSRPMPKGVKIPLIN